MPTRRSELQARRRAARAQRRRRRAIFASLILAALATTVAIVLVGNDEDGSGDPSAPPPSGTEESTGSALEPAAQAPSDSLSATELAGQRLVAGYDGVDPPRGLRRMIGRGELAGVILFEDNVGGRKRTRRAIGSLQRANRRSNPGAPLLVMVDQEGGLVERVPGRPSASAEEMGERSRRFALRQGRATARNLTSYGINVDLAPVHDLARRGSAIAGEGRSFGRRPSRVRSLAVNGFALGLQQGGVAATAKHFPGLGAARVNTDDASQRITLSRRSLRAADERPFSAFAKQDGELVMLGHATYTAFGNRPASLNRRIATGELRTRLGFEGVTITDSLDAAAITAFAGRSRVAFETADAGSDLLLYGSWETAARSGKTLRRKLLGGKLDRSEFEEAADRVLGLRRSLAG